MSDQRSSWRIIEPLRWSSGPPGDRTPNPRITAPSSAMSSVTYA